MALRYNGILGSVSSGLKFRLKALLGIALLLCTLSLSAQKQGNIWHFGNKAGLDFTNFDPTPLHNSAMDAPAGVAAITDTTTKQVLFYTDGESIWNSGHEKVNTLNLSGDPNSTQAATIVPDPDHANQYFVFTTRKFTTGSEDNFGGNYYTIEMTPGGTGQILYDYSAATNTGGLAPNSTEKFVVVPYTYATNRTGYWFLMHEFNSNQFIKVRLDSVWHDPVYQSIGTPHRNDTIDDGTNHGASGQMKVNDLGTRLALAVEGGKFFEVFSFNGNTGQLSRPIQIPAGDGVNRFLFKYGAYGVEFSQTGRYGYQTPSGNFLYGSARKGGPIYQWDLSFYDANDSNQLIKSGKILFSDPEIDCGSLQMAPNGKIYAAFAGKDYLGVISSPMRPYPNCRFDASGARLIDNDNGLGGMSTLGLPSQLGVQHNPEPFYFENLCFGDETLFYITDQLSVTANTQRVWVFINQSTGKTVTKTSTANEYTYTFTSPGKYTVRLAVFKSGKPATYTRTLTINPLPKPSLATQDTIPLCRGTSMELNAGFGAFYEWEDPEIKVRKRSITTDSIYPRLEYRVKVTDYHGCVGWDTIWVDKKIPPTIASHSAQSAFCRNRDGSATVIPNGNLTYYDFIWEGYPDEHSNTLSGINGGDYIVHVQSKTNGCEVADTIHVPEIGGSSVKIVVEGDSVVCPGTQVTLKVIGADEVQWVNPPGQTAMQIMVTPTVRTVYEANGITIDANRSCPTHVKLTIDVFPVKTPKLGSDITSCEGQVVKVMGESGFVSYLWSDGQTDQVAKITVNTPALTLRVRDENGCFTYSDPIAITFKPSPVVNLGPDRVFCTKDPVTLSGGTGDSYSWNNGEGTGQEYQAAKSGEYILEIFKDGCSSRDTVNIRLNDPGDLKILTIKVDDVSCFGVEDGSIEIEAQGDGKSLIFSVDGGITYFDNGGMFTDLSPANDYKIRVQEDSVCFTTWDPAIVINQPEKLFLNACGEAPTSLSSRDGVITIEGSGGTLPYQFKVDGLLVNSFPLNNLGSGSYTINLIDKNLCTVDRTVVLEAGTRIRIETDKDSICPGSQVQLTVINPTSSDIQWLNPAGQTGQDITDNPMVTTTYQVQTIKTDPDGNTCRSSALLIVNVIPDFEIRTGTIMNNTCFVTPDILPDGSVEIKVNLSGNYLYSIDRGNTWQPNGTFINLPAANDLQVMVKDSHGCTKSLSDIQISQPDSIYVKYRVKSPSCTGCADGQIIIKDISGGTPDYRVMLDGNPAEMTTTGLPEGNYLLVISDQNNCTRSIDILMDMLHSIPNVITPNNDRVNDLWKIPLLDGNENCEVSLYDLKSKRVFYSSGTYVPWNGLDLNGGNVPAGTYFYIIDTKDGDPVYTGSLTIIR